MIALSKPVAFVPERAKIPRVRHKERVLDSCELFDRELSHLAAKREWNSSRTLRISKLQRCFCLLLFFHQESSPDEPEKM
jgi:hypothetical protein